MSTIVGPPTINVKELVRILLIASPILEYIPEHEDHQNGGVLCVADPETGTPLLLCVFGIMTTKEYYDYVGFAVEKAKRLAGNPLHFTSHQSRDMTTTPKRYGGAIRGREFILSFSGFKEEQDEAAMLLLELGLIGGSDMAPRWLIDRAAANQYFEKLQQGVADF